MSRLRVSRSRAGQVNLCGDVLRLAGEQVVGEELRLHVLKAEAGDRVGEALAGDALFAEEQNRLFDHGEHLFASVKTLSRKRPRATFLPQRPPMQMR